MEKSWPGDSEQTPASPPLPPPPEPSQVFLQFTINHHLPLIWATLGVEYLTWQDPGGGVSQLFIPDIDGF